MSRGIRQGCPISALLYLFVAEILSLKLKNNNQIKGIQLNNTSTEIKNLHHADDVTLALKNVKSLEKAIETVEIFCKHAGSKINKKKTQCILLGNLKDRYTEFCNISVTNNAVRCLGIFIGHNKEQCYNFYWLKIYEDIKKLFESWKKSKLTIFGKTCVVNFLAVSKLIYVGSILPIPENDLMKKMKNSIFNFIWNKRNLFRRDTIIGKQENGGIGLVHIELKLKALKASWVKRLTDESNVINNIVNSYLNLMKIDLNYLLTLSEIKTENFTLTSKLPIFY